MLLNGDGNESSPGGKIDQKFKFLKHIFDAKNFDLNFIKKHFSDLWQAPNTSMVKRIFSRFMCSHNMFTPIFLSIHYATA